MDEGLKVLVFGDDGSAAADQTWAWVTLQRWPGWTVHVVSAHFPQMWQPGPDTATPHAWSPQKPRTADSRTQIDQVVHLTADADPRLVLLRSAGTASLMVIGPRGRGALKALLLGSTAEWLIHGPPAPLVIVRAPRAVRQVLVCVDGSAHADRAVDVLASMQWISECRVSVLSIRSHSVPDPAACAAAAVRRLASQAAETEVLEIRRDPLAMFVSIRQTILTAIHEVDPDLVVLGTRGLGFLKRMQVGSTASAICRLAPCSVLLAHADETGADHRDPAEPTSAQVG